jgi:hypothetical protein
MAKHAFSCGLRVPGWLAEKLDLIAAAELRELAMLSGTGTAPRAEAPETPPAAGSRSQRSNSAKELAVIHGRLSDIVRPALPGTILLLAKEAAAAGFWNFLGPVRLVRGLVAMAILCLAGFIGLALSPDVDLVAIKKNVFESQGIPLLVNLLFLLTAAGLGASFAALFQANRYIADGTFDAKYEASYWIRLILGLMAGLILSQMIPLSEGTNTAIVAKPTLAMLGGFSAAVVYRIMNRLVQAVESLVKGDTREIANAQALAAQARLASQSLQARVQLAATLTKLQQQIGAKASPEALQQELDRILGNLVPVEDDSSLGKSAGSVRTPTVTAAS